MTAEPGNGPAGACGFEAAAVASMEMEAVPIDPGSWAIKRFKKGGARMKAYRLAAAGLTLGLLTGCASLLERLYHIRAHSRQVLGK